MRILDEVSRSLSEYLLIPGLTDQDCAPANVSLSAPLVRHRAGGEAPLRVALPLSSAIMEAVSSPRMAIALALGKSHERTGTVTVSAQAR